MSFREALKQLMLGLIYPAVLGTVFYGVLGAAMDSFRFVVLQGPAVSIAPWLKWTLLVITLVFYCCDYLYIMFTRDFRVAFFVCDLILLAGLYITFRTIEFDTPAPLPHRNLIVVAVCYVGFMTLYLAWDVFERLSTRARAEQLLYNRVIVWELVSLVLLFAWLSLQWFMPNYNHGGAVLAMILLLVTFSFATLALQKRLYYRPPGVIA